ncbi:hypothetical protein EXE58_10105 [Nocardioides seonyuensis]|uniref:Calcium-binding protein n=1 Tax=Nocardioides seonyuensis TaxID=2518371 RepID=A0A4P7IEU0_9ACTN|nr:hypothetical protein [Nocardioides seonyuensis]QBX55774.1 hypothetical protein EXE58_10105 [Nocardioides seonyuensis]
MDRRLATRPLLALASAAVLVTATAAPSGAAVTVSSNAVTGDAANDSIVVTCTAGNLAAVGAAGAGDPCADLAFVDVDPGGGTDTVDLSGVTTASFPNLTAVLVDTRDVGFVDTVAGSGLYDYFTADADDVLDGAGGNDTFIGGGVARGGAGDDVFRDVDGEAVGGEGDDLFVQVVPASGIDGGPGTDTWVLDIDAEVPQPGLPLVFTLTDSDATIALGSSSPTTRPAAGLEHLDLTLMRHGSESYDGSAFSGSAHVRGLAGPDTLTGGPGADTLLAGTGNDTVTGGAGGDDLRGGDGDDTVNARDGVADRVDCGTGTDTVVADVVDTLTGCENVDVPAVPPLPLPTPLPAPAAQAPDTSAISGKSKVTRPRKAKFRFSSTAPGATFECRLDKGRWKACTSPHKVATKKLKPGKHKLQVRAVVGGLVDATPSRKTFKIKRR